jgi:hypothetical protein
MSIQILRGRAVDRTSTAVPRLRIPAHALTRTVLSAPREHIDGQCMTPETELRPS